MSYLALATMRQMAPDQRPDNQIQSEIEGKVSDFRSKQPAAPTPAAGLAGLPQRRANILAETTQDTQAQDERSRLYRASYGEALGNRLLGGPYSQLG